MRKIDLSFNRFHPLGIVNFNRKYI